MHWPKPNAMVALPLNHRFSGILKFGEPKDIWAFWCGTTIELNR